VPCIPHQAPAGLAAGGSRPADTIDHVHARAACFADLRDRAVRLMKRALALDVVKPLSGKLLDGGV
jgi:hypothetical protein